MAFIHDAAMAAYRLPIDYVNQQKSLLLMATDLGSEIVTSAAVHSLRASSSKRHRDTVEKGIATSDHDERHGLRTSRIENLR